MSEQSTSVLSMRGVTRVHGQGELAVRALQNVDLDVRVGELVAVMGPSGSGKSTLLTIAGGLDAATSGEVLVAGESLGGLRPAALAQLRRRSVGYVFQQLNLIPSLTAIENVMMPRELDGIPTRQARAEAKAALTDVDLAGLADRFPDEMSGGQQQRVAIVRALIGDRTLILADEPTGALDSQTGEDALRLIRRRCDEGAAGVLVTHDPRHAGWADRVIFLKDGSIVDTARAESSPESLLRLGSR